MMRRAAVLVLALLGQAAQATVYPCPPTVTVPYIIHPPAGFMAYEDGNPSTKTNKFITTLKLSGAKFSEGPPEQMIWLMPDAGGAGTGIWNFSEMHDENIWVSCQYQGSWLLLSKALPRGVTQCRETGYAVRCQ